MTNLEGLNAELTSCGARLANGPKSGVSTPDLTAAITQRQTLTEAAQKLGQQMDEQKPKSEIEAG